MDWYFSKKKTCWLALSLISFPLGLGFYQSQFISDSQGVSHTSSLVIISIPNRTASQLSIALRPRIRIIIENPPQTKWRRSFLILSSGWDKLCLSFSFSFIFSPLYNQPPPRKLNRIQPNKHKSVFRKNRNQSNCNSIKTDEMELCFWRLYYYCCSCGACGPNRLFFLKIRHSGRSSLSRKSAPLNPRSDNSFRKEKKGKKAEEHERVESKNRKLDKRCG